MGGNEWTMTGPYQEDLAAAFRQAQDLELVRDDRGFPGRGIVELWQDATWQEYIGTGGTGTVLDFYELAVTEDDAPFVMRPLSQHEVLAWAPDGRPTREQWDAAKRRLLEPVGRGKGRCTVLYRDGRPSEVGYWGCTAD
ncbi:hypothetical protein ACIQI7_21645 [Kitasatospora sp. NPDC092039]|uniref:hypothetical protein n=1 Tax=Kitasatospora sp. NPDC092039 TaxID=3364086 RepID=UPI00380EC6D9